MVEDHLREGLAARVLTQKASEAKRLGDGQVRLDVVEWGARPIGLLDNSAALAIERGVNATHGVLGTLNLDHEDWLHEAWLGSHHGSEEDAARGGDDLSAATVNGVRVQRHVVNVDPDITQNLVA